MLRGLVWLISYNSLVFFTTKRTKVSESKVFELRVFRTTIRDNLRSMGKLSDDSPQRRRGRRVKNHLSELCDLGVSAVKSISPLWLRQRRAASFVVKTSLPQTRKALLTSPASQVPPLFLVAVAARRELNLSGANLVRLSQSPVESSLIFPAFMQLARLLV